MDIALFDFLEGISPWWWVAGGIALGAIEMATMSFFLIWPGLAAIVMAVIVALFPGMPGEVQVAVYAAIAVALTFVGRSYVARFGDGGAPETTINSRAAQLVGRHATVISISGPEARVEVDGIPWPATLEGVASLGETVEVTGSDGTRLSVRSAASG